ncbi:K02A2.6-like [Cordylochernes scorpioides]|uniref:RNA-directed DNA polymerase n=1 Tax=Cordylochernes scorpioides TaxID=51811 RepID=A0ABY6KDG4_9ARAC|nr:K02A2.6-like [Cordylochernes scorpioides]
MQQGLADQHFSNYDKVKKWIDEWIAAKEPAFFRAKIRHLPKGWEKVVASDGQYFEHRSTFSWCVLGTFLTRTWPTLIARLTSLERLICPVNPYVTWWHYDKDKPEDAQIPSGSERMPNNTSLDIYNNSPAAPTNEPGKSPMEAGTLHTARVDTTREDRQGTHLSPRKATRPPEDLSSGAFRTSSSGYPEREDRKDRPSLPDIRLNRIINLEIPVYPFLLIDPSSEARIGSIVEESGAEMDATKAGSALEELELLRVEKWNLEKKILIPSTLQNGIERGVAAALLESLKLAEAESSSEVTAVSKEDPPRATPTEEVKKPPPPKKIRDKEVKDPPKAAKTTKPESQSEDAGSGLMLAVLKSIAGSIPGHRYDLKMLPGGRAMALILKNPEDKKLAVEADVLIMSNIVPFPVFTPDQDFEIFVKCLRFAFVANDTSLAKQVPVLLAVIGPKLFKLAEDLVAPEKLETKSFEEIVALLNRHLAPTPRVIPARYKFFKSSQEDETISQFMATLRGLAEPCKFGSMLNEMLRDKLVVGVRSENLQKRLLQEGDDATLDKIYEIALSYEAAERDLLSMKKVDYADANVHDVKKLNSACSHCGRHNHLSNKCFFKNAKCHECGKIGHIKPACKNRKTKYAKMQHGSKTTGKINVVEASENGKYFITLNVDNKNIQFEFDTGSCHTLMPINLYKKLWNKKISPINLHLKSYSNTKIDVIGKREVFVAEANKSLPLIITEANRPVLLGTTWIKCLSAKFLKFSDINLVQETTCSSLVNKFAEVFGTSNVGVIKDHKAHLILRKDANPRFFRARNVPYVMRNAIEKELENLEAQGVITKIERSDWATPIVPIMKKNGHAYLQLELDENSKEMAVINTHKGLYRYNRLPFGIASAPAIWQQIIEQILSGIPGTLVYLDDILITGGSEADHLRNLEAVLNRLNEYGLKANREKCNFSKKVLGLHKTNDKIRAVLDAPEPLNIDKECLSIIWALKKFNNYLFGRKFELITDNKPLHHILNPKREISSNMSARLQRWALILSSYNFTIEYRKTGDHRNADGLSRLPLKQYEEMEEDAVNTVHMIKQCEELPLTSSHIRRESCKDSILKIVYQNTLYGWKDKPSNTELLSFYLRREELTVEQGILLLGTRVVIPRKFREKIKTELHQGHLGVVKMKALARKFIWWPGIDREIEEITRVCRECNINNHTLKQESVHRWESAPTPWNRVHLDFAGPFMNKMFLIVIDSYSKWPEVIIMNSTTAGNTIRVLRDLFSRYGIPDQPKLEVKPGFKKGYSPDFEEDENILVRDFLGPNKWKEGKIVSRLGKCFYTVKLNDGRLWRRHVCQLRKSYIAPSPASEIFLPEQLINYPRNESRAEDGSVEIPVSPKAIEREPALRLGGLKKARRELILLGVNSDIKEEILREMVVLQNSGCGDFLKGYMRLYPKSTRRPYASNWVISGLKEATMKYLLGKERLNVGARMVPIRVNEAVSTCFRCLRPGHIARACEHPKKCGRCEGVHSQEQGCDMKPGCWLCLEANKRYGRKYDSNHRPRSTQCSVKAWYMNNEQNAAFEVTDPTDVSDHKLIRFEASCEVVPRSVERIPRYSIRGPNFERFRRRFACTLGDRLAEAVNKFSINSMVNELHQDITNTCKTLGPGSGKVTAFKRLKQPWWTEELEIEGKRVRAMRKLFQNITGEERVRRRIAFQKVLAGYKRHTKRAVSGKIRCSANLRLLKGEDEFKTRDLKETLDLILDRNFENEEPEDEISLTTCGLVDPPFSENEVKLTAFKFGKRKSPGPDGIYNTVVKALVRMHPSLLARLFNRCLDTGTFPEAWKVARVVLLEKSGRKGNYPNDYRPLSLLVCLGKVLDSLLAQRLKHWIESNELLSSFQHGFREGKSTTTSLNEVLEGVEMGLNKGAWVLLVALDIDGAFNSMSWNKLMRNLMDMGCPDNLRGLVRDFPRDRRISLSFGGRKLERNCARGCPQGSCCGPILWNILVNTVFQEELPEGARLVLYAEDQFLIIEAASRAKTENFKSWDMRTKRKGIKWEHKPAIQMEGRRVALVNRMTILGVVIDDKMGWQYQAEEMVARDREALCRPVLRRRPSDRRSGRTGKMPWDLKRVPWNGIGTQESLRRGFQSGTGVLECRQGLDELVFSAELVAIRKALRVCAEKNFSPDSLYSDCMSAFVAINLEKGQLAHQIIQELEMMRRAPELPMFRGHSLIEGGSGGTSRTYEESRNSVKGREVFNWVTTTKYLCKVMSHKLIRIVRDMGPSPGVSTDLKLRATPIASVEKGMWMHATTSWIVQGSIKLNPLSLNNGIYKVSCNDCEQCYIGETGRTIATRIREHSRNIRSKDRKSLIFQHMADFDHSFNLDDTISVYRDIGNKYQRLVLEALVSNCTPKWIPAHVWIGGNEMALELAKEARKLSQRKEQMSLFDTDALSTYKIIKQKIRSKCEINSERKITKTKTRLRKKHYKGMAIHPNGTRTYRACNNCPGVELTPTHIFSYPAMAAALQKFDIDPEQQLYTPKIVDIAAALMEMRGDI